MTATLARRGAYARHDEMQARAREANIAAAQERHTGMVERVEDWFACYGPDQAAERYPDSAAAVARQMYRLGRPDLARPFERVAGRERRAKAAAA